MRVGKFLRHGLRKEKGCRIFLQPFENRTTGPSELIQRLSNEWISHQKNKRYNQAVNGQ